VDTAVSGNHFNALELTNPNNSFSGTIEMFRGFLGISSDGALGNADNDIRVDVNNGNGGIRFDAPGVVLNANRSITLVAVESFRTNGFDGAVNGVISGSTLQKRDAGRLTLNGLNTYTGSTQIFAGALALPTLANIASTSLIEFNAASGDSGVLAYTGTGADATTETLFLDNPGITGTIEVTEPGASLTWTPAAGTVNQHLRKSGAGTLTFGGSISGTSGRVTADAGLLVLSGNNTFTGDSVVNGSLETTSSSSLRFNVTDTDNTDISGSGSALFNGLFQLDVSGVTIPAGVWTLVSGTTLNDTYGPNFSVAFSGGGAAFTRQADLWTSGNWSFSEATGQLTLVVPEPSAVSVLAAGTVIAFTLRRRRSHMR
jgi:autotransporter-associated beta strand protein